MIRGPVALSRSSWGLKPGLESASGPLISDLGGGTQECRGRGRSCLLFEPSVCLRARCSGLVGVKKV